MPDLVCACRGERRSDAVALLHRRDIALCLRCTDWLRDKAEKQLAAQDSVRVVGYEPIFRVANLPRAIDHYERLGFKTSKHDDGYAFAHRNDLTIHLAESNEPAAAGPSGLYIHVNDADELAAAWRKAGLVVEGPDDTDYGKREGVHVDPDGNRIRFGSPLRR
jgi:catechol 2,3-dioxygenase-like lactoylglutathione lyase family enzyme